MTTTTQTWKHTSTNRPTIARTTNQTKKREKTNKTIIIITAIIIIN